MPEPDLIRQQRELARAAKGLCSQNQQSLDRAEAAHKQKIASINQQWMEETRQLEARFAEFTDLERIARSKIMTLNQEVILEKIGPPASSGFVGDSSQTWAECIAECILEMNQLLARLESADVQIEFVDIPSSTDKDAIIKALDPLTPTMDLTSTRAKTTRADLKSGYSRQISGKGASKFIADMKTLGVTVEIKA